MNVRPLVLTLIAGLAVPLAGCGSSGSAVTSSSTSRSDTAIETSSSPATTEATASGTSTAAATAAAQVPKAWPEPQVVGGKAVTKAPSGGFTLTTSKGTVIDDSLGDPVEEMGFVDEVSLMHDGELWSLSAIRGSGVAREDAVAVLDGECDTVGSGGGARKDNQTAEVDGDTALGCEVVNTVNGQTDTSYVYSVAHEGHWYIIWFDAPFPAATAAKKRDAVLKGWAWGDQGRLPTAAVV